MPLVHHAVQASLESQARRTPMCQHVPQTFDLPAQSVMRIATLPEDEANCLDPKQYRYNGVNGPKMLGHGIDWVKRLKGSRDLCIAGINSLKD